MSSDEEDFNDAGNLASTSAQGPDSRKRRMKRACDNCRRKKIRCEGEAQETGDRCLNCITFNCECSYVEAPRKRGPPQGYVECLENRLEKMEKLLQQFMPSAEFTREFGGYFDRKKRSFSAVSPSPTTPGLKKPSKSSTAPNSQYFDLTSHAIRQLNENSDVDTSVLDGDDDLVHLTLVDNLKNLSIENNDYRFLGKSSGAMLVQTAINLKNVYNGRQPEPTKPEVFKSKPHTLPWERSSMIQHHLPYTFPDEDLMDALTKLYFENVNIFLPLLHRPRFERSIQEKLHLRDEGFATTLLLVCAVGSRWSNDPRVFLDGGMPNSCGWEWFAQVHVPRRSLLDPPTVYDLQYYSLYVQFIEGTSIPHTCWTMIGIGMRLAQDVGAHRRKPQNSRPTLDNELWKRAFWVLFAVDRMVSCAMGRPCAIQEEDFDVELPIVCDDEYMEHPDPEQAFKQPAGKPSLIACFVSTLKLMQITTFALRTIYSMNKSKVLLGLVGKEWEQHLVAELDSTLNQWIDTVPDHLRWDPDREHEVFFNQSVKLYTTFYHLQILIHRPYIALPLKPSKLPFPSLTICANAARSCSHIADLQQRRFGSRTPFNLMPVFTAGIVLLLSIWSGKRAGLSTDPNKEMADVHKCMECLRSCEERWYSAGRLRQILAELASVGDLPLPKSDQPLVNNKRERQAEPQSVPSTGHSSVPSSGGLCDGKPRRIAGNRRVSPQYLESPASLTTIPAASQQPPSAVPQLQREVHQPDGVTDPAQQFFTLLMHTNELGSLPFHGQVNFASANPDFSYPLADQVQQQPQFSSGSAINIPEYPMIHDPLYGQLGAGNSSSYTLPALNNEAMTMWSSAPIGFELEDWDAYLANVSELAHELHATDGEQTGGSQ